MTVGAERKRLVLLGVLMLAGGYAFYSNVLSGPEAPPAAPSSSAGSRPAGAGLPGVPAAAGPSASTRPRAASKSQEFRPSLKPRRQEDRLDPATIDPTLRLDLLAKVQRVEPEGGSRNLFQFAAPPAAAPKIAEKIVPKTKEQIAQELAAQQAKPAEPPKPGAPPINLKYYGFTVARQEGRKRAFFLDGDEILVAGEGDTVKRRYKVVRIGVNSVLMEDTESKSQQTLPLAEEAAG